MLLAKPKSTHPIVKYGGIRMLNKRIQRSNIIDHHKDAVAQELVDLSTSKITDVVEWKNGKVKLKEIEDIPESALKAIKKVRVFGKEADNFEIELHDKIRSLQIVAKAAGLLEHQDYDDRPAVIGIKIEGPDLQIKEMKPINEKKNEKKDQIKGTEPDSVVDAKDKDNGQGIG